MSRELQGPRPGLPSTQNDPRTQWVFQDMSLKLCCPGLGPQATRGCLNLIYTKGSAPHWHLPRVTCSLTWVPVPAQAGAELQTLGEQ